MGKIPDALSVSRLVLGPVLLFLGLDDALFYVVYAYCCLSDFLDGHICRRYGQGTRHGQVLDSLADVSFVLCTMTALLVQLDWEKWMLAWVAAVGEIRLIAFGYGTGRFGKVATVHTTSNKIAGMCLYVSVFLIPFLDLSILTTALCTVTSVSAFEYLLMNVTSDGLDRERRSVLSRQG